MSDDSTIDPETLEQQQRQAMETFHEFSNNMMTVAARSQQLVNEFLLRQADADQPIDFDPLNIGAAFMELTQNILADPQKLIEAQTELWQKYLALWTRAAERAQGQEVDPLVSADRGDKRFKDAEWSNNQIFDFIKQSYLLARTVRCT